MPWVPVLAGPRASWLAELVQVPVRVRLARHALLPAGPCASQPPDAQSRSSWPSREHPGLPGSSRCRSGSAWPARCVRPGACPGRAMCVTTTGRLSRASWGASWPAGLGQVLGKVSVARRLVAVAPVQEIPSDGPPGPHFRRRSFSQRAESSGPQRYAKSLGAVRASVFSPRPIVPLPPPVRRRRTPPPPTPPRNGTLPRLSSDGFPVASLREF